MFYFLRCLQPTSQDGEALLEIHNANQVGDVWYWRDGKELEPDEREAIPNPILMEFTPPSPIYGAINIREWRVHLPGQ